MFYSIRCISPASLVLAALLQAPAAHCQLLFGDPIDFSCLWLIDVRPLMRVSAPGACMSSCCIAAVHCESLLLVALQAAAA